MNFFRHQEQARKNTLLLIVLFSLAVIALIVVTNLFVMLLIGGFDGRWIEPGLPTIRDIDWQQFMLVGLGVTIVILAGSLYKIMSLGGGGKVVAESMGGQLVQRNTTDHKQRQLLNVVEEMAIASGTPAPPVYLLAGERGINAFAAGFTPRDAVIGVTQGLIDNLNRDELQGVIAHEFSHIFNGDMRLNIQLIGVLNGILIIGRIGWEIARSPLRSGSRRSRGNGSGMFALAGIGLLIIGYLGVLFGNLIKAAVSRQREFLADASAVQFTRNPQGIAGALKRIGGLTSGSRVNAPGASEISHAFFANGVASWLMALWATHPPLPERIRRIEPRWDGEFLAPSSGNAAASTATSSSPAHAAVSGLAGVEQAIGRSGEPDAETIELARATISAMPTLLADTARDPWGARALIYALLLDKSDEPRSTQLVHLREYADSDVYTLLQKLIAEIDHLPARFHLPLIDLALPALKQLSNQQYQTFRDNIDKLIRMDKRINLMEWAFSRILFNHLDSAFHNLPTLRVRFTEPRQLLFEISLILTLLAHAGHRESELARAAFAAASDKMGLGIDEPLDRAELGLDSLDRALSRLQQATPAIKEQLIRACATSILHDGRITSREIELLRAVADTLDCPIPMMKATDD
jgi:Zn-dependent protease with chaperone function